MSLQDYKKRDEPYTPQQEALMDILIQVESGGDDNAVGDKGKALGSLQIWEDYWFDATERSGLGGRYKDVTDRDYAKAVMNAYMIRYAGPAWSDPERFDPEKVARIHNGGPKGHSKRKEFTDVYWKKVDPRLEELPFDLTGGKTDIPTLEDWLAERRETDRILVSSKPDTINLSDDEPVIVDEPKEVLEFPPHPDGPIKLPPVEDLDATVAEGSPNQKTSLGDIQNPFSKGGVADLRKPETKETKSKLNPAQLQRGMRPRTRMVGRDQGDPDDPIGDMVLNLLGFESREERKAREARNAARIKETGGKPTAGGFIELSPELSQGQDLVFETLKHHLESGMSTDILKNLITGEDNISREYKPDPEFSWDNHQQELEELSKVFPSDGFSESIQNSKSLKEAQARGSAAERTLNLYKKQGEYFGTDGVIDSAQQMAFNVGFGLVDPLIIAPVGGVMAAGKLAGKFITGATTGARAARIAAQGGAGAAEGMLWAKAYSERSDPLRADPHYGMAAGVGTFLGVGFGALGERRGPTQKRLLEGFERKVRKDVRPQNAASIWYNYTLKEKALWAREFLRRRGDIDPKNIDGEISVLVKNLDDLFTPIDMRPNQGPINRPKSLDGPTTRRIDDTPRPIDAQETPTMVKDDLEAVALAREAEFDIIQRDVDIDADNIDPAVFNNLKDLVEGSDSGKLISKEDINRAIEPVVWPVSTEPRIPSLVTPESRALQVRSKKVNKQNFDLRRKQSESLRPKDGLIFLNVEKGQLKPYTELQPFGVPFGTYKSVKKDFNRDRENGGIISRKLPDDFVSLFLRDDLIDLDVGPVKWIDSLLRENNSKKLRLPLDTLAELRAIREEMATAQGNNLDVRVDPSEGGLVSGRNPDVGRLEDTQAIAFGIRITNLLIEQGFDGITYLTKKNEVRGWKVFEPESLATPDGKIPTWITSTDDTLPTTLKQDMLAAIVDKYRKVRSKNPPAEEVDVLEVISKQLDEKLKQDRLDREGGGEVFDGFESTSKNIDSMGEVIPFVNPIDSLTLKEFTYANVKKWFNDLLMEDDGNRVIKWVAGGKDELLEGIRKKINDTLFSEKNYLQDNKITLLRELNQIRQGLRARFPETGKAHFDDFYHETIKDWVVKSFVKDGQFTDTKKDPFLGDIVALLKDRYKVHDDNLRKRNVRNKRSLRRMSDDDIDDADAAFGGDTGKQMRDRRDKLKDEIAEGDKTLKFHEDILKKLDGEEGGVGFIEFNPELVEDIVAAIRLDMSKAEGLKQPVNKRYPLRSKAIEEYNKSFDDMVGVDDELAQIKQLEADIITSDKNLANTEANISKLPDAGFTFDEQGLIFTFDEQGLMRGLIKYIEGTDISKQGFKNFDEFFNNEVSTWFKDSFVEDGRLMGSGRNNFLDTFMRAFEFDLAEELAFTTRHLNLFRQQWADGDKSARVRGDIATYTLHEKNANAALRTVRDWQQNVGPLGQIPSIITDQPFITNMVKTIRAFISRANDDPRELGLKIRDGMLENTMDKAQVKAMAADSFFPKEAELRAKWNKDPVKFAGDSAERAFPNLEKLANQFNEIKTKNINLKVDKLFATPEGRLTIAQLETQHNLPVGGLTDDLVKRILKPDEDIKLMFAGLDPAVLNDILKHFTKVTGKGIRALKNVFKKIREFFIGLPRGNNKGSFDLGGILGGIFGKKKKRVIKNDFLDQWGKDETGLTPSLPFKIPPSEKLKKLITWSRSRRARTQSNEVGLIRVLGQWAYGSERFRIDGSDEVIYAGARSDRVSIQQGIVRNRMKRIGDFKTRMAERQRESKDVAKNSGFENAEALNEALTPIIFEIASLEERLSITTNPKIRDLITKRIEAEREAFLEQSNFSPEQEAALTTHLDKLLEDLRSLGNVGTLPDKTPFLNGSPLLNWSLFRDLNQVAIGDSWLNKIIMEAISDVNGTASKNLVTVVFRNKLKDNQNLKPFNLTKDELNKLVTTEVVDEVNKLGNTTHTTKSLIDQVLADNGPDATAYINTKKVISSVALDPEKVKNNLEGGRLQEGALKNKISDDKTKLEDFTLTDLMSHDLFDTLDNLGTAVIDSNLQKDIFAEFQATLKGFQGIEGIPKDIKTVRGMFDYLEKSADELSKRGAISDRKEFDTMLALLKADLTGDRPSTKINNSVVTLQKVASATSVLGFSLPALTEALLPIVRNIPRSAKKLVKAASKLDEEGSIDFVRSAGVGTDSALFANTGSNRKSMIFDDTNPMSISNKPDLEVGPDSVTKKVRRAGENKLDKAQNAMATPLMKITAVSQKMAFNSIVSRILDRVGKFKGGTITKDNIKDIIDPKIAAQMGWNPQDSVAIFNAIRDSFARNPNATTKHGLGAKVYSLDILFGDMDVATKERFSAGLYSWVGQNIVRPDMGDLPLFLNNSFVKLMGQFRSFGIAQYSKFTGPLIQRGLNPSTDAMGPLAFLATTMGISAAYNMLNYSIYNEDEGEDDFKRLRSGREMKNNLSNAMLGGLISPLVGPAEFAYGMPMEMLGIHYGTEWYDDKYNGKYGPAEDLARQTAAARVALDLAVPIRRGEVPDAEWFSKMSGFHKMIKLLQLFDVVPDFED